MWLRAMIKWTAVRVPNTCGYAALGPAIQNDWMNWMLFGLPSPETQSGCQVIRLAWQPGKSDLPTSDQYMIKSRYRRILWFFGLAIANFIWLDLILSRIGFRRFVRRNRSERLRRLAVSFRRLAIDMGGVMIKVGQFLSARLDILPRRPLPMNWQDCKTR
jgi:hypothetical protein